MGRKGLITGLVAMALCLSAAEAGAAEQIRDGSFETMTTCAAGDCTNPAWTENGIGANLCGPNCGAGARTGVYWTRFTHTFIDSDDVPPGYFTLSYLEQYVPIPSAPAVLRFYVGHSNGAGVERLEVKLDGKLIATPEADGVGSRPYTLYEVDVSQFAGPGSHALRFEYGCINTCAGVSLDDVSLDAAEVPPDPPPEEPPVTCGGRVATVVGTDAGEKIAGSPDADVIAALGGDDTVKGGPGRDIICGGAGNDRLNGQGAKDILLGEDGKDRLGGGGGRGDLCDGGNGKDKPGRTCEKTPR